MLPIFSHVLTTYPTDSWSKFIFLLFWGLIFALIGFFVGWSLWRHWRSEYLRLNKLNQNLEEQRGILDRKFQTLDRTFSRAESSERNPSASTSSSPNS